MVLVEFKKINKNVGKKLERLINEAVEKGEAIRVVYNEEKQKYEVYTTHSFYKNNFYKEEETLLVIDTVEYAHNLYEHTDIETIEDAEEIAKELIFNDIKEAIEEDMSKRQ